MYMIRWIKNLFIKNKKIKLKKKTKPPIKVICSVRPLNDPLSEEEKEVINNNTKILSDKIDNNILNFRGKNDS